MENWKKCNCHFFRETIYESNSLSILKIVTAAEALSKTAIFLDTFALKVAYYTTDSSKRAINQLILTVASLDIARINKKMPTHSKMLTQGMTIKSRKGYQCKQPQPQNVCVANLTRMIDYSPRFITLLGTYLQVAAAVT